MLPRRSLRAADSKSNSSTRPLRSTTTRVSSGCVASISILLLDMCADPWRAGWAACRLAPQFAGELGQGRQGAGLGRASLFAMMGEKQGVTGWHADFCRRAWPGVLRGADGCALEPADGCCRSYAFQGLSMA